MQLVGGDSLHLFALQIGASYAHERPRVFCMHQRLKLAIEIPLAGH